jgi:uncharacterized damage-inducible protein DinB
MPQTPYSKALGDHDALASLREMHQRYHDALSALDPAAWDRPLAPGKWTIAQLVTHLLHAELAFCLRVRMAVTTDAYTVQPFDQDAWMAHEMHHRGADALAAWTSLRRLNVAYFSALTPDQLHREATHPDFGPISPLWIIEALAGHDRHHWPQLTAALGTS